MPKITKISVQYFCCFSYHRMHIWCNGPFPTSVKEDWAVGGEVIKIQQVSVKCRVISQVYAKETLKQQIRNQSLRMTLNHSKSKSKLSNSVGLFILILEQVQFRQLSSFCCIQWTRTIHWCGTIRHFRIFSYSQHF